MRLPARARRAQAAQRLPDNARLPRGLRRRRRGGGELRRPGAAADPHLARAEALDLAALLRARCVQERDRALARPRRPRRATDRGQRDTRADGSAVARDRLPAPAVRRHRRREGAGREERWARGRARAEWSRPRLVDEASWPLRDQALPAQPLDLGGGRRAGARVPRIGGTGAAPPTPDTRARP